LVNTSFGGVGGGLVNRYGFNGGNEYEDEGELNYSNTFYRKYDAQIGRFTGVDMLAEKFASINPYQFGFDNPVMFNDPLGDQSNGNGRMQKGPDGNYHAGWVNKMMWNNAGFFDWENQLFEMLAQRNLKYDVAGFNLQMHLLIIRRIDLNTTAEMRRWFCVLGYCAAIYNRVQKIINSSLVSGISNNKIKLLTVTFIIGTHTLKYFCFAVYLRQYRY
jgi:RHS repeat-associated protein